MTQVVTSPKSRHVKRRGVPPARVLILIDLNWYGGEVVRGIQRYAAATAPGSFRLDASEMLNQPGQRHRLKAWAGDGIIVRILSSGDELHQTLGTLDIPIVNVAGYGGLTDLPSIIEDDRTAVRMATEHLLERTLNHFVFYGNGQSSRHRERARLFGGEIEAAGGTWEAFLPRRLPVSSRGWRRYYDRLAMWLRQLPRATGLMAASDHFGWQALEAARSVGIQVPEDLAIVGTTNNELICRMTNPALSSVAMAPEHMGYEAAALLHRMIAGEPPPPKPIQVAPAGVVSRQSTNVLGIDDGDVREAVRFIEEYADHPIQVDDVVAHVSVSRRSLERRFLSVLGQGPHKVIREAHVRRAAKLLRETDRTLAEIAGASGFSNATRFTVVFREHMGVTPSEYRRQSRTRLGGPGK